MMMTSTEKDNLWLQLSATEEYRRFIYKRDPTLPYPIWIDDDEIYCDPARLKFHLTQKLRYDETPASRLTQKVTCLLNVSNRVKSFWDAAAEIRDAETVKALLQSMAHQHRELLYLVNWQKITALGDCHVANKRSELTKVLFECLGEDECIQLLNISGMLEERTPLHVACGASDIESVRLILQRVPQDKRYSLLELRDCYGNTPLHQAAGAGYTDIMRLIYESVTGTQWFNLLQIKARSRQHSINLLQAPCKGMTVLQAAIHKSNQASIQVIKDSVSNEMLLQLIHTPLPEYKHFRHNKYRYQ